MNAELELKECLVCFSSRTTEYSADGRLNSVIVEMDRSLINVSQTAQSRQFILQSMDCRRSQDDLGDISRSLDCLYQISYKRCIIQQQLLQTTSRKSYTSFRLVPLLMTLKDI